MFLKGSSRIKCDLEIGLCLEEFIFNVLTKKRNLERAVLAIESRSAAARLSAKKKRDEACEDAAKVDDMAKLPDDDDDDRHERWGVVLDVY